MFEISVNPATGGKSQAPEVVTCGAGFCELGKSRQSLVRLKGWKVAPSHIRIEQNMGGLFVEDISRGYGLQVNGENGSRFGPLGADDVIAIGGYHIRVNSAEANPLVDGHDTQDANATEADRRRETMEWSKYIHNQLFKQMDLRRMNLESMEHEVVRDQLADLVDTIIVSLKGSLPSYLDPEQLRKIILDEALGLGPLEDFLDDEAITEIMVNRHDDIYVEKAGRLQRTEINFSSDEAVLATIERIISPLGRRIDESSPMVDARLQNGSRVNAIIPPLALKGPCLTIRKFSEKKLTDQNLLQYGSVNEAMISLMKLSVEQRLNVIVSGGTGSGKTTLLNILSNFIPVSERVVTVEDAAELKLAQPHVVSLEARPPNMEGKGQVTIRDLVKNCLRMRPDRIVVGECRGGEALDMLQAMNTGHDGSLTTAHANTPRDMLRRLEVMVLMAGMDLPVSAIREQIASAVNIVIQQSRFADGSRKIVNISEVTGIESGTIQLQEIFLFKQTGFDGDGKVLGDYVATGNVPHIYESLKEKGLNLDLGIFSP